MKLLSEEKEYVSILVTLDKKLANLLIPMHTWVLKSKVLEKLVDNITFHCSVQVAIIDFKK